jgi:putative beta-lysine N-acetyltransferase
MTTITTPDQIIELAGAKIQHGSANDRVYLMKLKQAKPEDIMQPLLKLCQKHGYSKIFARLPASHAEIFLQNQFEIEAKVPNFYCGSEEALFLGRYFNRKRRQPQELQKQEQILELAISKANSGKHTNPPTEQPMARLCRPADIPAMAKLYQQVFASYPFPIDDHDFLLKSMSEQVIYYGIWQKKHLVALASAELDLKQQNAEMTDFATLPSLRGTGYANLLLKRLEQKVTRLGISTAYTIARAMSPGMNITFARQGYQFAGRLINNTNICGKIESMNVWHKQLNKEK